MKTALVLYGATDLGSSHFSGDILWRSGFKAPDPFPLVEIKGKALLLASSLELERAAKEARVDKVVHFDKYLRKARDKSVAEGVTLFLKEQGVKQVVVSSTLPYPIGKALEREFTLKLRKPPIWPQRARKTVAEIAEIEQANQAIDRALDVARRFLQDCRIKNERIYTDSEIVTSEKLRGMINRKLFAQGYLGSDTIVASGMQAADPHCTGRGPLLAQVPIVIDVFPLSLTTHYYADETRTIFKGEPHNAFKKMYQTVLRAQNLAMEHIKAGVDGYAIWNAVIKFFKSKGYPTNVSRRPMEGFIHGVGHGVGIEIHEPPYISKIHWILEERNVVTVEPGLYYPHRRGSIPAGGVRIEDTVVVEKGDCRPLSLLPKDLDWAIIP